MTWIKICGTTNLEDALMSVEAGVDALGFVFWEKSPRRVAVEIVGKIVRELPANIEKVGVFVSEPLERVAQVVHDARLTAAQLHYADREEVDWGRANFKKYLVVQATEFHSAETLPSWPDVVFLDSGTPQKPGGTGLTFNWRKNRSTADVMRDGGRRFVVAGGLTAENVGEAIRILEPWGVDVVSGVEASPGKKDPSKVREFIQAVRKAKKR